jgi:hypothetical protein
MLQLLLLINCISCAIFGAFFVLFSATAVTMIGDPPQILVILTGFAFLFNAILLGIAAARVNNYTTSIGYFIAGEVIWFLITLELLASGLWIVGTAAITLDILIAALLGLLGFGKWFYGIRGKQPLSD